LANFVNVDNSLIIGGDVRGTNLNTKVFSVENVSSGTLKQENGGTGLSDLTPGSIIGVDGDGKIYQIVGAGNQIISFNSNLGRFQAEDPSQILEVPDSISYLSSSQLPSTFLGSPINGNGLLAPRYIENEDIPDTLDAKILTGVTADGNFIGDFIGEAKLSGEFDGNFNGIFTGDGSNLENIQISSLENIENLLPIIAQARANIEFDVGQSPPSINLSEDISLNKVTAAFYGDGSNLTNIPNEALQNSTVTINGAVCSLGESISLLDIINFNTDGNILVESSGSTIKLSLDSNYALSTIDAISGNFSHISSSKYIGDGFYLQNINPGNLYGSIPVNKGGSGLTSYVSGAIYIASSNTTLSPLTGSQNGQGLVWSSDHNRWNAGIAASTSTTDSQSISFNIITTGSFSVGKLITLKNNISLATNITIPDSDVAGVISAIQGTNVTVQTTGIAIISGSESYDVGTKLFLGTNGSCTTANLVNDGNVFTLIGKKIEQPNKVLISLKQIGRL
jgi:hypothetical protein